MYINRLIVIFIILLSVVARQDDGPGLAIAAAGLLLGVGATLHHAAQFAEAQAASQSSDGGHASNTETPRS